MSLGTCVTPCIYFYSTYKEFRPLVYMGVDEEFQSYYWTMWDNRDDADPRYPDRVLVCKDHQEYYLKFYTINIAMLQSRVADRQSGNLA